MTAAGPLGRISRDVASLMIRGHELCCMELGGCKMYKLLVLLRSYQVFQVVTSECKVLVTMKLVTVAAMLAILVVMMDLMLAAALDFVVTSYLLRTLNEVVVLYHMDRHFLLNIQNFIKI